MKLLNIVIIGVISSLILSSCANKRALKYHTKITPEVCSVVTELSYAEVNKEEFDFDKLTEIQDKFKVKVNEDKSVSTKYGKLLCPTYREYKNITDEKQFPIADAVITEDETAATLFATVIKTTTRYVKKIDDETIVYKDNLPEYVDINSYGVEEQKIIVNGNNILNNNASSVYMDYIVTNTKYNDTLEKLHKLFIKDKEYKDGDLVQMDGITYYVKIYNDNYQLLYYNQNLGITTSPVKLAIEEQFQETLPEIIGNKFLDPYKYPTQRDLTLEDVKEFEPW